jgi:hypothetical protein
MICGACESELIGQRFASKVVSVVAAQMAVLFCGTILCHCCCNKGLAFVSDERAQSHLGHWVDECAWVAIAAVSHASRNATIFTSDHKSALTPVHAQLHICRPADLVHLPTRQNCAPHMPKVQHQLMAKQLHNICDQSASRMDKIETALIMPKFQQKQTMYKLA